MVKKALLLGESKAILVQYRYIKLYFQIFKLIDLTNKSCTNQVLLNMSHQNLLLKHNFRLVQKPSFITNSVPPIYVVVVPPLGPSFGGGPNSDGAKKLNDRFVFGTSTV